MNEQIKELAEQAGFSFKYKTAPDELNPGHKLQDLEKFAELIVRECMKESMEEIISDEEISEISDPYAREYLKGNNQGIVDAVVRFRNHFGVEE